MPAPSMIDIEEAARLNAEDPKHWNTPRLAAKYGVSKQAVASRLKQYREQRQAESVREQPWPWKLKAEHYTGSVMYESMLALRKMYDGKQLSSQETTRARGLLAFSARMDVVITYDPERGFMWTTRRPEDADAMFVTR